MAEKIVMPQLGESVTEGTISKWLVNIGDKVKKYDPVCEVITDKVTAEVPSAFSGTISEIVVQEGETVAVGALLCCVAAEDQAITPVESKTAAPYQEADDAATQAAMNQYYSPAVLKLAQENNLDLSRIEGSGVAGRITRKDILKILQGNDETIPVTAIRKTIATRMLKSKQEIPHAWLMVECDVTELVRYRDRIKEEFQKKEGIHLTYLPFFIKSVAEALKEFPILNSQWADDRIIVKKAVHISIAVATDQALFVPVIKDADQQSISGLAKAVDELVTKTREGRLTAEDTTGGTFTVNNTGTFGSVLSAPIINHPQAAILSVEAIVKRPIVIDNMITVRDMMNICLSLDHRVLDGLVCGRFLKRVKQKIEGYGTDTGTGLD
ncbi:dihydrolipoamide acetyltransferase family protein [Paenibacillus apiarius]|uniref:Dihydrolipoamide acetyltransferase component of pyruvate dehydrogenase complex n=1 Tax=Paenibacillus apiarius TaxID=46240 RepID=A0ABT4E1K0_9BACL|nr:dihydrolipoamide acetyltransferase family protein [Paenibacillus apiarius]MCY9516438.1 2-oxo acid dehydrogenase subunit E2 [Paenibacillus apiarius]MCY9523492.1 2-oxo acid dehydrogenase subunit E2 [Paenibacillus apiarius]MCY9554288.1 2-oxo acid dehydrogenase subunit E2 [Paenibacillus apiarius]MCY9561617.1 2-oxo acid dehydrogenase subunit E2 [Paenibacillus apiarius]MCY9687037.1 2-oxo acid dehydrogenase subunit E2 [Paenibacillus apiarius]